MYNDSMYGIAKFPSKKGEMGHDKSPRKCNVLQPVQRDAGKAENMPKSNLGYPQEAWNYKY